MSDKLDKEYSKLLDIATILYFLTFLMSIIGLATAPNKHIALLFIIAIAIISNQVLDDRRYLNRIEKYNCEENKEEVELEVV